MKSIIFIFIFSILSNVVYCQSQAKVFESSVHPGWAVTDSSKTSASKENKSTKWTETQMQKNAKIIVGSYFAGIGFGLFYW